MKSDASPSIFGGSPPAERRRRAPSAPSRAVAAVSRPSALIRRSNVLRVGTGSPPAPAPAYDLRREAAETIELMERTTNGRVADAQRLAAEQVRATREES
ncbi:hypothetical protein [Nonomuraea sp. NPDC049784]|uniref:hypothetical protein n=1 Tax=Nonomuraea sp. NPDC049784 TaxID=3154361 RepID=UPI0033CD8220